MHYALGTTVAADDNLFRLPDATTPADVGLSSNQRSDTIVSAFADATGVFLLGRQSVRANLHYAVDRFDRQTQYNDTTARYGIDWDWTFAGGFDGRLGYQESQDATSLADYRGSERNVLTTRTAHAGTNYRPRPDRRVSLVLDHYVGSNSVAARDVSDYEVSSARLELAASSALAHELSLAVARTEGRYPNREIVAYAPVDNSYAQSNVDVGAVYAPGSMTRIDARFGHAWRRYDEVSARNFDGPTWRVAIDWQPLGKVMLNTALSQELGAVDDYDRIYVSTRIERASLTYLASAKTSASLTMTKTHLRYRGDPNNALSNLLGSASTPDREDDTDRYSASLRWEPVDRLSAEYAWIHSQRNSNRAGQEYRARQHQITLQYQW